MKDYIAAPKPNGYRSLHAIVDVPIFLSTGQQTARVEVQLRTIAMDFWASLEHKIFYQYRGAVPDGVQASLTEAATTAARLDDAMERLHRDVHGDADDTALDHETAEIEVPAAVLQRLMQLRPLTRPGGSRSPARGQPGRRGCRRRCGCRRSRSPSAHR